MPMVSDHPRAGNKNHIYAKGDFLVALSAFQACRTPAKSENISFFIVFHRIFFVLCGASKDAISIHAGLILTSENIYLEAFHVHTTVENLRDHDHVCS